MGEVIDGQRYCSFGIINYLSNMQLSVSSCFLISSYLWVCAELLNDSLLVAGLVLCPEESAAIVVEEEPFVRWIQLAALAY